MPGHRAHVRSSRRVPPLTDKEIDHEIRLVDRDESAKSPVSPVAQRLSIQTSQSSLSSRVVNQPAPNEPLARSESQAPLTQNASEYGTLPTNEEPESGPSRAPRISEHPDAEDVEPSSPQGNPGASQDHDARESSNRRSTGIREPEARPPSPPKEIESEIDILYENQRGGFLCGIPLFSSAALGNLDPPAWTNFAHKPSPTDIHTAQVPDPSWQWAWPEWRVNHDDKIQTDSDGWEYSFMFSSKFSWHGPKWYNSFVRRRAWIRRRIKINVGYQAADEHVMNPAYFTVSAKHRERSPFATVNEVERTSMERKSRKSQEGSSRRSRERSRGEAIEPPTSLDVKTTEDLMTILRQSRIDRERLEAVENYINNCTDDLLHLQDYMHEIMSMFVFQTSRKTLLARLTELYDVTSKKKKEKSIRTSKTENLAEAIKHADEEVRRLEYWSDIKGMAENGETVGAVDHKQGWDSCWQGLDNSGAKGINNDEIP
ncbi:hypothetical protein GGR55DRAFT_615048 [Xylaria sp. FL0064]|nr:hypothetical protein GGR55DRAFT_615048 [Xylaria sp. FL0064]